MASSKDFVPLDPLVDLGSKGSSTSVPSVFQSIMGLPSVIIGTCEKRIATADKLNLIVEKKTKAAVEESKKTGGPLSPEFVAGSRPKSVLWAGVPIYEVRTGYLPFVYMAIASGMIAYGTSHTSLATTLLCGIAMFVLYDFYSGILHVVLDCPANIALPVIGQPCLEFQWHHSIPDDIVRKPFVDVVGDLNVVCFILMVIHITFSSKMCTDPVALTLTGFKLFMAYFGQFSHRSAHDVNGKNPVVKALQKAGLMISTRNHQSHHKPPHDKDFCLIGVCNPIFNVARTAIPNDRVWLVLFTLWTFFDVKLATMTLTSVAQALQA